MKIKPFKGIRPPKELVEQVSSRPYDVLNSDEARKEAAGNDMSLYHIIKPEINFEPGTDEHDPRVYGEAKQQYQRFKIKGWLVQDEKEHYYVYAQTMNGKTQYGLVVAAWVDDYLEGRIKKHELTRRDKEEDRMKHVRTLNANMEPVFFAYPHRFDLDAIVADVCKAQPEYDFVAAPEGFRHTFWIINDKATIDRITAIFEEMPQYTVTVTQVEGGTITANPTTAYPGDVITLSVTTQSGFFLTEWNVVDGNNQPITVTNNEFTMPSSNVTVTATFSQGFSVTLNQTPNGTISADQTTMLQPGDIVTLTATPDANCILKTWYVGVRIILGPSVRIID